MEKTWRDYINYYLIGFISVVIPIVFSFVGSAAGLAIIIPTTIAGWIVWGIQLITVSGANVAIFHCFIQQAKINAEDNKQFKAANELLNKIQSKENIARSPQQFFRHEYGVKGISLFISSALSVFSLGQAILAFNLITFISYLITMAIGVIASYFEMKKVEEFWITEYYLFAQQETERQKQKQKEQINNDINQQ